MSRAGLAAGPGRTRGPVPARIPRGPNPALGGSTWRTRDACVLHTDLERSSGRRKAVLDSRLLLRLRVLGDSARTAHRQIESLLVFAVPALQGILGWLTQLTDGRPDAFAELDVQLDRSNPVFVRIHELPRGSPSFFVRIPWRTCARGTWLKGCSSALFRRCSIGVPACRLCLLQGPKGPVGSSRC